jgi:hypothetical protein
MGIRAKIKRLERLAEGEMITVPQQDGTVAKFPQSALQDAMANLFDCLGAGEDAPPEHPLIEAARNSSDPKWTSSFFAVNDPNDWREPIVDLSE